MRSPCNDYKFNSVFKFRMKHLNEHRVLYSRMLVAVAVIAYWNWQTGGFGAKKEFLRHLQSASVTAAAAATVADGIAAVERNKANQSQ